MKQNIFPAYKPEEVLERVKEYWDFVKGFPIPKKKIRCPVCGSEDIQARNWQFVYKDSGGCKYRCNVSFKCTVCSNVWTHGVVVPKEIFKMHVKDNPHKAKLYHWREVRKILEVV